MQSATSPAASAAEHQLTPTEIDQANLHLEQTCNGVVGAITGLSEAQWRFKPAPNVWSIAENVEHIAFVQERLLGMIREQLTSAPPAPADRNIQSVDAIVIYQFPNRFQKFPSPGALQPKGDWALLEARERVTASTRKLAECLETIPDLREHALDAPPLRAISKGEHQVMDGYQWILAAGSHTERHTKQILEVKADPKFPVA